MNVTAGEVLALVADRLVLQAEQLDPECSFVAAGADSLSLMALARAVQSEFGVRVSVRELFTEVDNPRKLAEAVAGRAMNRSAPAASAASAAPAQVLTTAVATAPVGHAPVAQPPVPTGDALESALALFTDQLQLAGKMMTRFSELTAEQLKVLRDLHPGPAVGAPPALPAAQAVPETDLTDAASTAEPVPVPGTTRRLPARASRTGTPDLAPVATAGRTSPDFSLYFFGDYPAPDSAVAYQHLLQAAEYADELGFHALWLPERHFHSFGALFPNPSVLAASLATRTSRIRLHAGSVVLPLHNPVRVAEEWAVVDNLSGGRVGLGFASGWHSTDFVLAPENYGRQRDIMYEHLDTFRSLWSGRSVAMTSGDGRPTEVSLHPRPVQGDDVPLFAAVLSNPESYERAARAGLGVVTNLMTQSVEDLATNIARYRAARAAHGHDPATGRVVVLVHTYLEPDAERARQEARKPFCDYLRSSIDLFDNAANSLGIDVDLLATHQDDLDYVLDLAYERYCETRALIGNAAEVRPVLDSLTAAGADEIGCFIDFGVPP